jgi:Arylsulfotransferase (ASST)
MDPMKLLSLLRSPHPPGAPLRERSGGNLTVVDGQVGDLHGIAPTHVLPTLLGGRAARWVGLSASLLASTCALGAFASLHEGCTGKVLSLPDGGENEASSDAHSSVSDAPPTDAHARDSGAEAPRGDSAASPYLVELSVTDTRPSDASPPLTLIPTFDPNIHDYYVRCAANTNSLAVSMRASAGAESSLLQPIVSASRPTQSLHVDVQENQAVVGVATDGAASTEYWVRCLPPDFPELSWSPHASAGAPTPGYYLVGTYNPPPSLAGYAMVLDLHGVPVWYHRQGSGGVMDVDSLERNAISFYSASSAWQVLGLSPRTAKTLLPIGVPVVGSELRLLPNGNYLVISDPVQTGVDLTGLSLQLADGGVEDLGPDGSVLGCNIIEFEPTRGAIVWEWRATDHFDPVKDCTAPTATWVGHEPTVDAFHCDSIDVEPASGDLLVSAAHMSSIFYIDRPTGAVIWKMGGAVYSKDPASYVPVSDAFHFQHDARLQPGWSNCTGGSISLFDDETEGPEPARAVLYDVSLAQDGGCGSGSGGATVAWQYRGLRPAPSEGSFRILDDGSRTIGWGVGSRSSFVFSEVDPSGRDRLDFSFASGEASSRAVKAPLTEFDLSLLRATAGLP